MRSQLTRQAEQLSLMQWEQKPTESENEYRVFLEFANHPDPTISPVVFCQQNNYDDFLPSVVRFAWSSRKSAMIEYQGLVTGLRAKQTIYHLLKETVERIEVIERRAYEDLDRAGMLSEDGERAMSIFFKCSEMAARLTNAINDKSMKINVITQVNASLPVLSGEWDNPGETIIDGDG